MPRDRHVLKEHYGGWLPSLPGRRHAFADVRELPTLPEVDPRTDLPGVYDQAQLGSCTANATCGAFEYDLILDGKLQPGQPPELSRLFIYWQERELEGSVGQGDTGAFGSDAFRVATNVGVCKEADWPYDPAKYNQEGYFDPTTPPDSAVADEKFYVLAKPVAQPPPSQIAFQQVLSNRQTIAFGFTVYESFEATGADGVVAMPGANEQVLGGHEVLLVGYLKDEPNYGLVRNSWGSGWGLGGYCLMPWQMILSPQLSGDWTTIQRPAGQ